MKIDVDKLVNDIENLRQGEDRKYYDDIYTRAQEVLNGDYSQEDKLKIYKPREINKLEAIYMMSSFSLK